MLIHSISIQNYKCIRDEITINFGYPRGITDDLKINPIYGLNNSPLSQINVIFGPNNSGKSTILDAIKSFLSTVYTPTLHLNILCKVSMSVTFETPPFKHILNLNLPHDMYPSPSKNMIAINLGLNTPQKLDANTAKTGIPPILINELTRLGLGLEFIDWARQKTHPKELLDYFDQDSGSNQLIKVHSKILESDIAPLIIDSDEISKIHPIALWNSVLPAIIRSRRQTFMACHNTALMQHLDRENIFLTSLPWWSRDFSIYRLSDIKGVRKDSDFEKFYLSGCYGAVPNIG